MQVEEGEVQIRTIHSSPKESSSRKQSEDAPKIQEEVTTRGTMGKAATGPATTTNLKVVSAGGDAGDIADFFVEDAWPTLIDRLVTKAEG